MNKQELIKHFEEMEYVSIHQMGKKVFIDMIEQLDEPQLLKLKDVIARIKGFDLGTKAVWIDAILSELGSDYGTLKYKAGYEQGKFEGEWVGQQLKDADKIRKELNKPTIPRFVSDWIEECKDDDFHLFGAMEGISSNQKKLDYWFREDDNMELFARAWLDGYEVEEEKRYYVRFKWIEESYSYLTLIKHLHTWTLYKITLDKKFRTEHTRKQLEEAHFGWVFDCPGIEIEEVEE